MADYLFKTIVSQVKKLEKKGTFGKLGDITVINGMIWRVDRIRKLHSRVYEPIAMYRVTYSFIGVC